VSDLGKRIRLRRILKNEQHKALIVAFDHAQYVGPIPGTEDPAAQVRRFAEAQVDGILMTIGGLKHCTESFYSENAPSLILRLDWTPIWRVGPERPETCMVASVENALALGADAVMTYMFMGTGDPDFEAGEIARNAKIARECESLGMPHIIEPLARGKEVKDPNDPQWVRLHTRIASELGADLIKTDYTGDPVTMRSVIEVCPTPILALGGAKTTSDEATLEVIRGIAQSGAQGLVFGRNVFQAENVVAFIRRAQAVLAEA
jgi:DhnA family fructose-bisphosphate aldolase class Ia